MPKFAQKYIFLNFGKKYALFLLFENIFSKTSKKLLGRGVLLGGRVPLNTERFCLISQYQTIEDIT